MVIKQGRSGVDLKDHFFLCFCSLHKIKTQIAGGFLVLTAAAGGLLQNLSVPLVLLLFCIEYSAPLVLLGQAVLVFCQCDRLSSSLTMPGTILCLPALWDSPLLNLGDWDCQQ